LVRSRIYKEAEYTPSLHIGVESEEPFGSWKQHPTSGGNEFAPALPEV
jgi:hypothetical protein